ncbi:MAG TPA: hypothetical protein PLV87_17505, partial [Opitutaceae bacterium]|nr:hypothetical protein [Opitutaceae bacterium]
MTGFPDSTEHFWAALTLSSEQWLWPLAGILALFGGILLWSYLPERGAGAVRWGCFALKLVGFAALAACLLEPLWLSPRARQGANFFAIVADNSEGLNIRDEGATHTRGDELKGMIDTRTPGWQSRLGETFEVRRYLFDSRLLATLDFRELDFKGRSSGMIGALTSVQKRFQGRPLAGLLLFTDGNATDLSGSLPTLEGMPPIYPVVLGARDPIKDISVQRVNVSQTAFEDAPVIVQVDVASAGFQGRTIAAQMLDSSGRVAQEQAQTAGEGGALLTYRFSLKPEGTGVSFYRLSVGLRGASGGIERKDEEATM